MEGFKRNPNVVMFDLLKAISQKRCMIEAKLVLIANRKSYMSFWLVPKSVTLNGVMALILHYFTEFSMVPSWCTA